MGKARLIDAQESDIWREALAQFLLIDVCHLPEYHLAYCTCSPNSRALMWCFSEGKQHFCYPFLLSPVYLKVSDKEERQTDYFDISSVYGYSGPLASSEDRGFLGRAWREFDTWLEAEKVIAEFTRFSCYADTKRFAHSETLIELNRSLAVSNLPKTEEELLGGLGSKTRNMIRKAQREGLESRELNPEEWISGFKSLYQLTMDRNQATDFFFYSEDYYNYLLKLPDQEFRLFGVFKEEHLVAGAIVLVYQKTALYHLGANLSEFSVLGASNLVLFELGKALIGSEVEFLNLGGGRTSEPKDPLLRFKKSNSLGLDSFYIGKRVVDLVGYQDVKELWATISGDEVDPSVLLFYR